jgi:hypothetical protein
VVGDLIGAGAAQEQAVVGEAITILREITQQNQRFLRGKTRLPTRI